MAFLAIDDHVAGGFVPAFHGVRAAALPDIEAGRLSALEWSVVAVARKDGLASLREPGRVSLALGTIFGSSRPRPRLADPRLEALRRIAVFAWLKGYAVPPRELAAFLEAGFTPEQYETLQTSIGQARAADARRTRQ
ncbi:hypothetical protein ACFQ1E_13805 [Sphingomonas canadensis]|uniref:Uncharacterized protein n=1 Tax=Sphingomonas canadensis TaxID=1219257 RepID=A0ABW3H7G5_9SPHN|nr:hypothetical protein [Sphingomonas canadensis]MCW3836925.1 hypothetical protein [Sphingomonas canadensis]